MKFVIFHGSFGEATGNWFPDLKQKLEVLGQEVILPQFPTENWKEFSKQNPKTAVAKKQNLNNWLKYFEKNVLPQIKKEDKLCFVAHSLGPLFVLHCIKKFNLQLDSAIFVAPTFGLPKGKMPWQIDVANDTFNKHDFDFEALQKKIPVSYVLYSDNDPYIDRNDSILFGKAINSSLIYLRRAAHMNVDTANLNEFPLVFDLCCTRLDLNLYQGFLLKNERQYLNRLFGKTKGVFKLLPDDVIGEGVHHFQNVRLGGWGTFFTGISKFWDPESLYMKASREMVKRLPDGFTRVFVLEKVSDLKNKIMQNQIDLDLKAGIKVAVCKYKDIKSFTKYPDFGIWDNEYICTVKYNDKKVVTEIEVNSLPEYIHKMNLLRERITKKSTPIHKLSDLKKYY